MNDGIILWLCCLTVLSVIGWTTSISSRQNLEIKLAEAYYQVEIVPRWARPREYIVHSEGEVVGFVQRDYGSYTEWNGSKKGGPWFYGRPQESLVVVLSKMFEEDKE